MWGMETFVTMLLFVRKQYADAIREGRKPFEIRAGARYRNVRPGDVMSINGAFRAVVTRVDRHTRDSLIAAMPDWSAAVQSCYPDNPGPYFVFHFGSSSDVQPKAPGLFD